MSSGKSDVTDTISSIKKNVIKTNDSSDVSLFEKKFMALLGKLYSNPSITNTLVNEIVNDFINYTKEMTDRLNKQLKDKLPVISHKEITSILDLHIFEKSSTEYRRIEYFRRRISDSAKAIYNW